MKQLGNNMRRIRQQLGLTPTRAAEGADMSTERWKSIEAGYTDPSVGELENISNVLRTAPHILTEWRPKNPAILTRIEANDYGLAVVIDFCDKYRPLSGMAYIEDGYIRIEFEEARS